MTPFGIQIFSFYYFRLLFSFLVLVFYLTKKCEFRVIDIYIYSFLNTLIDLAIIFRSLAFIFFFSKFVCSVKNWAKSKLL